MENTHPLVQAHHLPFYITGPADSDGLMVAVVIFLIGVIIAFGAFYFTVQAIPDRLVAGASKPQLQIVGLLGLLSLLTMNNIYWVAALLIAAVRIPDVAGPLRSIARSLKKLARQKG